MQQPQVLVVGAGPSGLLLALSLLRNGISARIIEKEDNRNVGDRGAGVMPRTIEVERLLGVDKDVLEHGIAWSMIKLYDIADPHRVVKSWPVAEQVEPTPSFPITKGVMLGQTRHQEILRKHLNAAGGTVEFNTSLVGLVQDEEGVVAEITKIAPNGEQTTEKCRYAYVVGADGARSFVRKTVGINYIGESREDISVLLDAQLEGVPENESFMHLWGDATKAVVSLRNSSEQGMFHCLFAGPEINLEALRANARDPEAITQELQRISGRTDIKFVNIHLQSEWRPNIRMADRFRVGRVFIIGDAAHVHPPTGGQGLNTSVLDAFNLAWKLSFVIKGLSSPPLLDSYETERMPVIAQLLNISTDLFDNITDTFSRNAVKQVEAQNQTQDRTANRRRLFQLDVNYRWSNVVLDERFSEEEKGTVTAAYGEVGHVTRAGDRAPDAPGLKHIRGTGEARSRLFDIFSPALHTILVFASSGSDSVDKTRDLLSPLTAVGRSHLKGSYTVVVVQPQGSADGFHGVSVDAEVYEDVEGHAFSGYGIPREGGQGPTAVFVRPDSWIGAFATSRKGVEQYLGAVFSAVS